MYPLWDQIKAFMQSISGIVHKQADTLDRTAATANEAHETALYSRQRVDEKMDAVNPTGTGSFSLGRYMENRSYPVGENSIAMGKRTFATKENSIAIGEDASSWGISSIAIGSMADAKAPFSSAIGNRAETNYKAEYATAIGNFAKAYGGNSVAIGSDIEANYKDQTVLGVYSKTISNTQYPNERGKYSFILGNGTFNARSNAMTIDWNGNAWFQGEVYVGGEDQDNGAMKLVKNGDEAITLKSPDGSLFTITVGNDGTLSAAKAS